MLGADVDVVVGRLGRVSGDEHATVVVVGGAGWWGSETVAAHPKFEKRVSRVERAAVSEPRRGGDVADKAGRVDADGCFGARVALCLQDLERVLDREALLIGQVGGVGELCDIEGDVVVGDRCSVD